MRVWYKGPSLSEIQKDILQMKERDPNIRRNKEHRYGKYLIKLKTNMVCMTQY